VGIFLGKSLVREPDPGGEVFNSALIVKNGLMLTLNGARIQDAARYWMISIVWCRVGQGEARQKQSYWSTDVFILIPQFWNR
jgi:hypothetical protein